MNLEDAAESAEEELAALSAPAAARLRVFEGEWREDIPHGFDAVTIPLNGRLTADLDWREARQLAKQAVERGYVLMWDMQLGLFDQLLQPLANQTQFLSFTLALQHFRDSLWQEFAGCTMGISLYRGSADFSQGLPWDREQEDNLSAWLHERRMTDAPIHLRRQAVRLFSCDAAVEYLTLLSRHLPDALPAYLYLDVTSLAEDYIGEMQLLHPERYDGFNLVLKGHQLPFEAWGWDVPSPHGYSGTRYLAWPDLLSPSIGVCLPSSHCRLPDDYQGMEEVIEALKKVSLPFKLMGEEWLTSQWDGLDYLVCISSSISVQGKRKLMGFCAAGGTVVSVGVPLGLPHETMLTDWLRFLVLKKSPDRS